MANGRGDRTRVDGGRDPGRFIGLPVSVLESAAYLGLSANARSLLLEVALQFHGDDNGRMLLSRVHMKRRGWRSSDMIDKGKRELLEAELIFETVKGHRPNKASWYAMTWRKLDKLAGLDHGVDKAFRQGAYKRAAMLPVATDAAHSGRAGWLGLKHPPGGSALNPSGGTGLGLIGPSHGTESRSLGPQCGPVARVRESLPVPPSGHPLEKPSDGVGDYVAARTDAPRRQGTGPRQT